ncbi:sortase [Candidatus Saccharibacteria bacterium]|nr:sortase [Candidatus Saccharibacteria bacterium]
MRSEPKAVTKARYISSVTIVYGVTLLFAWFIINPGVIQQSKVQALPSAPIPNSPYKKIMAGLPARIVLPDLGIDLPIDPGFYNPADKSWTLSGYRTHYAMVTTLPNNHDGNTFIYGHNNKYVFGPVKSIQPGQKALVYTQNNYIFTYSYVSTVGVEPDDTSVFDYSGPPILTIQTCSGNWNEVRQMYTFKYQNFNKL